MDAPFPGVGNVGGGGGDLCRLPSEHHHKIYCNKAYYGPVSSGGMAPRISGIKAVVGTGLTRNWSIPRRPLFLHALSFECTTKLCINSLDQFSVFFTFK